MKRLILTSSLGDLHKSELAEIVVMFFFRFAWGPLPSHEHFAAYFGPRSGALRPGDHWSAGLGATEMRFLELLARGFANTNALFHLRSQRRTYVFGEFELGSLLEGLALGPKPAVAGLGDELRTIDRNDLGARHQVYLRSRLSLSEFGKAVLAHQEDFSRHNPIDRWWGGTHLTNDWLLRFGAGLTKP